ncbi:hypothetical protein EWM64_g4083 [Hericium alpestre]|uniref:Zn(2)-C6 fungal-type domain-containing protein n=1 Tax=Hericium alpestre TaxID=135208 RepID=A0A4Z0A175_9AGAM|nr:hypothetical protein EWM64_g4083 [Hericium alpestre]
MVASVNDELYTPFPRITHIDEGFQSSEEGSELHSPIFEQPFLHLSPAARYQGIDPAHLPNTNNLITSSFQHDQFFDPDLRDGAHMIDGLPGISLSPYNTDLHVASFASSASLLGSPPRFLSIPDASYDDYTSPPDRSYPLPQPGLPTPSSGPRAPVSMTVEEAPTSSSAASTVRQSSPDASASKSTRGSRKDISNVVIACRQCRARKIRCDSTRPECNNCVRRSNECIYDAVPKRRGPDKRPGTRQRSCKKRPTDGSAPHPKKRRKTESTDDHPSSSPVLKADPLLPSSLQATRQEKPEPELRFAGADESFNDNTFRGLEPDGFFGKRRSAPSSRRTMASLLDRDSTTKSSSRPFDFDVHSPSFDDLRPLSIPPAPSTTEFSRRLWWNNLLETYSTTREQSISLITSDFTLLFNTSGYWLSFLHLPFFFRKLFDEQERLTVQPALVYAGLALALLMKASELEGGQRVRDRAVMYRDSAQASLEASWNTNWIDLGLAEAAMMIALFETCAHPDYSAARAESALAFLDNIVRALRLTSLDAHDPSTLEPTTHGARKACNCINLPQGSQDGLTLSFIPAWDPDWSYAETQNEETRRLCWSALMLAANHTVACAALQRKSRDLFLNDSSNFKLLFPGEYYQRNSTQLTKGSSKDSVWALYCRSMLLWNSCMQFQNDVLDNDMKAQIAVAIFVETNAVDQALDAHICNIDTSLIYMSREFICNTRLAVTHLMRRILLDLDVTARPVWNRRLAEEWLYYQDVVARKMKASVNGLGKNHEHPFLRRPALISWFTSQVAMCLNLWSGDHTLLKALELAKSFLVPLEALNILWPCEGTLLQIKLFSPSNQMVS